MIHQRDPEKTAQEIDALIKRDQVTQLVMGFPKEYGRHPGTQGGSLPGVWHVWNGVTGLVPVLGTSGGLPSTPRILLGKDNYHGKREKILMAGPDPGGVSADKAGESRKECWQSEQERQTWFTAPVWLVRLLLFFAFKQLDDTNDNEKSAKSLRRRLSLHLVANPGKIGGGHCAAGNGGKGDGPFDQVVFAVDDQRATAVGIKYSRLIPCESL